MRTAFMRTLHRLAGSDPRVVFMTGDLGFGVVEEFQRAYPKQFVNAGVAEQNMTGMAAGMALAGKIVFTYSIANFPIIRSLEQVRNDVCYHDLDVKIVSVGGGFAYGALGYSHHAVEDLAIMRALPNMTVVAPGDPVEAAALTEALVRRPGPAYLRLGKAGEPRVHDERLAVEIGRAIHVRDGDDVTLASTGGMLASTMEAAERLAEHGVHSRVLSMHTIRPIDSEAILKAAAETRLLVTIEEHSIVGGLGSAVLEVLADAGATVRVDRIALPSEAVRLVGSQDYLRARTGLDVASIVARVRAAVSER